MEGMYVVAVVGTVCEVFRVHGVAEGTQEDMFGENALSSSVGMPRGAGGPRVKTARHSTMDAWGRMVVGPGGGPENQ